LGSPDFKSSTLTNQQYCLSKEKQHRNVTFVLAGGRPSSNFLFFLIGFFLPPVARLLCQELREIPEN